MESIAIIKRIRELANELEKECEMEERIDQLAEFRVGGLDLHPAAVQALHRAGLYNLKQVFRLGSWHCGNLDRVGNSTVVKLDAFFERHGVRWQRNGVIP